MNPKILIPVDDSPTSLKTVEAVIAHKERFPKKVTLLHVVNDQLAYRMIPDFQIEMVRENAGKAGQVKLEQIGALLHEAGFEPELRLEYGPPRRLIPQIANDEEFQLLVIGRHAGTGEIRDVLFGSVANYVLHNVKCPVLLF
ncbi:universal stress protein [Malonomonas rubra]|uniref:universal stress protein n=1 Tax=Malonomonas rubra TaxID=57040 RepID=UPI0026F2AB29|nr:universal stress protein [Malonomonas rubra]